MDGIKIYAEAVTEIKNAIMKSRYRVSVGANIEQLTLYYNVGRYVSDNSRTGKWATGAIESISEQLQSELPGIRGFSPTNMKNMRAFYEQWVPVFETNRQLATARIETSGIHLENRQLPTADLTDIERESFVRIGFTHHREILRRAKTNEERWYYILRCAAEFWNVLSLKNHLKNDDYSAYGKLPNNFSLAIKDSRQASLAVRSFKDDYLLDYIYFDDPSDYDESDVSGGVVANIKKFIMNAGSGFCFIGDQIRVIVGEVEFFVDLLFFHRDLHCLIAFELKRGFFSPSDLGQLNFYLSALDKYYKRPDENKSIGILLCKDMNKAVVELAVQDYNKPIGVATYRIGNDMPEAYKALRPVIDGVQQILEGSEVEG